MPHACGRGSACKGWLFFMLRETFVSFCMLAWMDPRLCVGNGEPRCCDLTPYLCEPAPRPMAAAMPTAVKSTPMGARRPPRTGADRGADGAVAGRAAVPGTMSNVRGADLGPSDRSLDRIEYVEVWPEPARAAGNPGGRRGALPALLGPILAEALARPRRVVVECCSHGAARASANDLRRPQPRCVLGVFCAQNGGAAVGPRGASHAHTRLEAQLRMNAGIFGCDGYDVFASTDLARLMSIAQV